MDREYIVRAFEKVDLDLRLTGPLAAAVRGGRDIFQMDVRRPPRPEHFVMYPGADDNRVVALGSDKSLQQIVLMVHEPRRAFDVKVHRNIAVQNRNSKILTAPDVNNNVWVRQWTPDEKRHFLLGMDEAHYFLCRLPSGVSSVKDAHASLKPAVVHNAKGKVERQGEWFFVEPSKKTIEGMEEALDLGTAWLWKKIPIAVAYVTNRRTDRQAVGNPHIASEAVNWNGRVFVRGQVRHVDHATVEFYAWREVFRNTEPGVNLVGMTWVD